MLNKNTSLSYDLAISTNVLAAGWAISNKLKIVAPSLLIVVLLFYDVIILSIPLGPILAKLFLYFFLQKLKMNLM